MLIIHTMKKTGKTIFLSTITLLMFSLFTCNNAVANDGDVISVTINPSPTFSKKDTMICQNSIVDLRTLIYNLSANSTVTFYKDSAVKSPSNEIIDTRVSPMVTTTYYVQATNTLSSCSSAFDSVVVYVNAPPSAPNFTPSAPSLCIGATLAMSITNMENNCNYLWVNKTSAGNAQVTSSGIITGIAYGSDTLSCIATDTLTGCSISKDVLVKVNKPADVANLVQPAPLCEREPLHLEANATGDSLTYQWYLNGQPISGATSSTYDIASIEGNQEGVYTVKVTNECNTQGDSSSVYVTVLRNNLMVVKWDDVLIINNHENKYIAYQWYKNGIRLPGETKQFIEQKGGLCGTFHAEITRVDGTKFMTCDTVICIQKSVSKVYVYPNPVIKSGDITIKIDGYVDPTEVTKVEMYNVLGQQYGKYQFTGNEGHISANAASGTYMLIIYRESGEKITEKILIQNY